MKNFLPLFLLLALPLYGQQSQKILEARKGQAGIAEISALLKQGVNAKLAKDTPVSGRTFYKGTTPLMMACLFVYSDLAEALINEGADINASLEAEPEGGVFAYEYSPLVYAIEGNNTVDAGNTALVKLLLQKGAKVRNEPYGNLPLVGAAVSGMPEMVRLLLEAGAKPNCYAGENFTPLMAACVYGHLEIASMLIKAGADVWAEDFDGRTALSYAEQSGKAALESLIRNAQNKTKKK